jgi:rubrerythrin
MSEIGKQLLDALRQAITAEQEGYGFYLMAAKSTQDDQGRTVFQALAEEELHHAAYLKAQYRALAETGHIDAQVQLGRPHALAGSSPIFSPALRARIGEAHFEMSALGVGVHLEQSAIDFYRAQAQRATDPAVRRFFEELAEWERGHHDALLAQQRALQDDYWSQNGFAPF